MATANDLKEMAEWAKAMKEAVPPDPEPIKDKGGRPKRQVSALKELDLSTKLQRAITKLETVLEDGGDAKQRLAASTLVDTYRSMWEVEQKAKAVAEERAYTNAQSNDKKIADGIKSLGLTVDDVAALHARNQELERTAMASRNTAMQWQMEIDKAVLAKTVECDNLRRQLAIAESDNATKWAPFVKFIVELPEYEKVKAAFSVLKTCGKQAAELLQAVGRPLWLQAYTELTQPAECYMPEVCSVRVNCYRYLSVERRPDDQKVELCLLMLDIYPIVVHPNQARLDCEYWTNARL